MARRIHSFGPEAVSFVSASQGWALADGGCSTCQRLDYTADAAASWTVRSRPPLPGRSGALGLSEGLDDLYFADQQHGFIFATSDCESRCVERSADAGSTWTSQPLPVMQQILTVHGYVYALSNTGERSVLYRSTLGSRTWTVISPPHAVRGLLAVSGTTVAVLMRGGPGGVPVAGHLGSLVLSHDRGSSWIRRRLPCRVSDGSAQLIALADTSTISVDCFDGRQSSQAQTTRHVIYRSTDDGASWQRIGEAPPTGGPQTLLDTGHGHLLLAVVSGFDALISATLNNGASWTLVAATHTAGYYPWGDIRFVTPDIGYVLGPSHYAQPHLLRTVNGGITWTPLRLPPP